MRLPQDVFPEEQRGRPQPELLAGDAATYATAHLAATRSGDFEARATALWGLVQNGSASLGWVAAGLSQHDIHAVADALGVLGHIGVPGTWLPMLANLAAQLPEGEPRDVLDEMLTRLAGETTFKALPINPDLLFDGRLDAFTRSIAFIEAPLAEVEAAYRSWARYIEEHGNGRRLFRPVSGSLDVALGQLEPVTYPSGDALLLETSSRWTAAFSRSADVLFAQTLGNLMQRRNVRTSFSPHITREGQSIRYGNRAFALADGRGQLRSLQASFQSRWQWNAIGNSLPFERSDAVVSKRIPDRLTLDDINAYCKHLGIQRNEPSFYGFNGFLVEEDRSDWKGELRTMTSAEWLVDHS